MPLKKKILRRIFRILIGLVVFAGAVGITASCGNSSETISDASSYRSLLRNGNPSE